VSQAAMKAVGETNKVVCLFTFKPIDVLTEHLLHEHLVALCQEAGMVPLCAILVVEHDCGALPLSELVLVPLLADPGFKGLDGEATPLDQGLWDADIDGALGVGLVVHEEGAEIKDEELGRDLGGAWGLCQLGSGTRGGRSGGRGRLELKQLIESLAGDLGVFKGVKWVRHGG